jgi:hypothetical protein
MDVIANRVKRQDDHNWRMCNFHLSGAVIPRKVYFTGGKFHGWTNFEGANFRDGVVFTDTEWKRPARFNEAVFGGMSSFSGARFHNDSYFRNARFDQKVTFYGSKFSKLSSFAGSEFGARAGFRGSHFRRSADFCAVLFRGLVNFNGAFFGANPKFGDAEFLGAAHFNDVQNHGGNKDVLQHSKFFDPESVEWGNLTPVMTKPLTRSGKPRIYRALHGDAESAAEAE